jgi:hypothetical protein
MVVHILFKRAVLCIFLVCPLILALYSPLLAWRSPVYIGASLAGIVGLMLLLVQPILATGIYLKLPRKRSLKLHHWCGAALFVSVILHVSGLWLTSPPDVIDALTFMSPTPFSLWGVLAMWGAFVTAGLVFWRHKKPTRTPQSRNIWAKAHTALALFITLCTSLHALLIDGTMEPISKIILCGLAVLASLWATYKHWRNVKT